ncbi:MAG: hypothetical protein J2P17_33440 [Mycobacterium sp.]|nr:hypothetical protein [Mycobacterium sp.]
MTSVRLLVLQRVPQILAETVTPSQPTQATLTRAAVLTSTVASTSYVREVPAQLTSLLAN